MKKFFVLLVTALFACKSGTEPTPRTASLVIVTTPQSILTVNSTVQLTATVYDQQSKAIANAAIDWTSDSPTVGTVSSSGLVTGVGVGSVTIHAASGGIKGEATLTIDPDPCTTPITLNVGQVRELSGPTAVACITMAATTGPSDFLFVTSDANQTYDDFAQYTVNVSDLAPAGRLSAMLTPGVTSSIVAAPPAPDFAALAEANVREQERKLVPMMGRLRRNGAMLDVVPGVAAASVPSEGQTLTYNVPNVNANNLCTVYTAVQAVVKKVSQHAIIAQDVNAPANGFTQADFDAIAAEWETLQFPTDTLYFGAPTDRNQDGHVTLLYTNEVNRATAPNAAGFIAGFFWGGDLVSQQEYAAEQPPVSCPQTNFQEMFYLLVPDPLGTINGNVRTAASVRQNTRGTIAHEFQHMINQGSRLLNPNVDSSEVIWLNESLSHFAEEINGRVLRGFTDFQPLAYSDIDPNPANHDDFNAFFVQDFIRLKTWLLRPDTSSATSLKARTQLAPRGAGWMFLRYLTDQYSGNNAKQFLRHLVAGPDVGIRNLVQWSNGGQFDDMLRGFLISQFTDDFPGGVSGLSPLYSVPSLNLRDIFHTLTPGGYPLLVTPLPANITTQSLSGSGNFFRLTRATASPATTFHMVAPGGGALTNQGVRVYIVRLN